MSMDATADALLTTALEEGFRSELAKLAAELDLPLTGEHIEKTAAGFIAAARGLMGRAGGAVRNFVGGGTNAAGIPMQGLGEQLNPLKGLMGRLGQGVRDLRAGGANMRDLNAAAGGAARAERALGANLARPGQQVESFERSFGMGSTPRATRPALVPPAPDPDVVMSGGLSRASSSGTAAYSHPLLRKAAALLQKRAVSTPVGAIMSAAHHGVAPEALGAVPAFKQLKNVTRAGNTSAAQRIGGNLNDYLKTRPQPAV